MKTDKIFQDYNRWLEKQLEDTELYAELLSIQGNDNEISERFSKDLRFGTGGLRGILGAGTGRMNIYTVAKATQGLSNYLLKSTAEKRVAVSFDSRNKSSLFAKTVAEVFAANGIKTYIFNELMPTPMLSFAVRELGCGAGVMITASHNPAKYNGYKTYGSDGCQMTDRSAADVYSEISNIDIFDDVLKTDYKTALGDGRIEIITQELITRYFECVKTQSLRPDVFSRSPVKIVFTPLNGTGNIPVRRILNEMGVKNISIVAEQEHPDGNFTTCTYPNPETATALTLGIDKCRKEKADLLIATDPDCDRIGIAVLHNDEYIIPSGNEIALLLLDYIASARRENNTMPKNPVFIKTIVTTHLSKTIAAAFDIETREVLTGFKYIGEQITFLEKENEQERFVFGCEESNGYLAGTHARDKDAVVAAMLIVEMASYYAENKTTVYDQLNRIYERYGYEINDVESYEFEGIAGIEKIDSILSKTRSKKPISVAQCKVERILDYQESLITDNNSKTTIPITLPKSNVLQLELSGGACVTIRPSGTEPKLKIYLSAKGKSTEDARKLIAELKTDLKNILGL